MNQNRIWCDDGVNQGRSGGYPALWRIGSVQRARSLFQRVDVVLPAVSSVWSVWSTGDTRSIGRSALPGGDSMSDRSESISGHGLASPQSTVTITFDYTGDAQSWTVPTGVTEATFVVNGAAGGFDVQNATGLGGQAEATLAVTAGAVYTIVVGGAGESIRQAGPTRSGGRGGYGYGPGGAGGAPWSTDTSIPGAGGGGGSAVLLGTDVLLVGGGGGGSSNNPGAGGAGGGARGSAGQANTTDPDHV
jgi:hypothetical protein